MHFAKGAEHMRNTDQTFASDAFASWPISVWF